MNFKTTKLLKRRKTRPKRKNLNKWEKLFIERYGTELFDKLRYFFPNVRLKPSLWKKYLKYRDYFGDGIYAWLVGEGDDNNA